MVNPKPTKCFLQLLSLRSQLLRRVVIQRCSRKLNDMEANPLGQFRFGTPARCSRQHYGDNISFVNDEVESVQTEECDHHQERHTFVAVSVRMILHDAISICRSHARKIRTSFVRPFVARSSESGLQESFVP